MSQATYLGLGLKLQTCRVIFSFLTSSALLLEIVNYKMFKLVQTVSNYLAHMINEF